MLRGKFKYKKRKKIPHNSRFIKVVMLLTILNVSQIITLIENDYRHRIRRYRSRYVEFVLLSTFKFIFALIFFKKNVVFYLENE